MARTPRQHDDLFIITMSMTINLITPRAEWKKRAWKTLNIVVGLSTLLNVSAFGAAMVPTASGATAAVEQAIPAEGLTTNVSTAAAMPTPSTNPPLGQSCGLDITLILDRSGTIDSAEMSQIKTAATAFVNGFTGTPTQFSITSFSTAANRGATNPYPFQPNLGFTSDLNLVKTAIAALPAAGSGGTNWDDGLASAQAIADPRPGVQNLYVLISDGNPNKYSFPPIPVGSADYDPVGAINAAVTRANAIKATGTRILAIGVGINGTASSPAMNIDNLKAIAGPNIAPPAAITAATDVITSNYSSLTTAFSAIAKAYCGGKIVVQKQVDTNNDGISEITTDNPALSGWSFNLNGTAATTSANPQTTTNSGKIEFAVPAGDFSITETVKSGATMSNATCVKGTQPIGSFSAANHSVSGLTLADGENITCTVLNYVPPINGTLHLAKVVSGGTAVPADWMLHVQKGGQDVVAPVEGSQAGTDISLAPGTYDISETGGLSGYTASFSEACSSGSVTVTSSQTVSCTITNTRDTGTITVHKTLKAPNGTSDVTNDPHQFTITLDGASAKTVTGGQGVTFYNVATGPHTIAESPETNYELVGYAPSQSVTVAKGQTSNITVTNKQKLAHITVVKDVRAWDGQDVADSHQFSVTLNNQTKTFAEGSPATFEVTPGTYAATEGADANYTLGSINPSQVTVGSNGTASITITNLQLKPPDYGTVAVQAKVDTDGTKQYTGDNAVANAAGIRWGLNAEGNSRLMGTSVSVLATTHALHDNYGNGIYDFTGWYATGTPGATCGNTPNTSFPSSIVVQKNQTTDITLCYAARYGHVTFQKIVQGGGNANDWFFQIDGITTIPNGQTANLPVGPHTVTEVGPNGYSLVSVTGVCTRINGSDTSATLNVTKEGGSCVFTNSRNTGSLTVHKAVDIDGTGSYTMNNTTANNMGFRWGLGSETPARLFGTIAGLGTDTYAITEKTVAGYHFTGWYLSPSTTNSCSNPQGTTLPVGINIGKDQNVSLTLCNAKDYIAPGTIVVHKTLKSPDGNTTITNDNHAFTITLDGTNATTITAGQDVTFTNVSAGQHTLAELGDANYTLVGFHPSATVTVASNQTTHVDLTNKQKFAHVTVWKDMQTWDGKDAADGHVFTVTLGGVTKNFSKVMPATFDVVPGTYSAVEGTDPLYTLKSIAPNSVVVGSNGTASITVTNVQNKNFNWTVMKTGPATAKPGDQITYDVTWNIADGGNTQLHSVSVTDILPANTTFVSATNGGTANGNTVTWNLPATYGPGSTGTVHVTVKIADHLNPATLVNVANVCAQQSGLSDAAVAPDTTVCRQATASTTVTSDYTLTLTKTSILTSINPGAQYTYSLNWSAAGSAATTSALTITDTLPANVSFVSASDGGTAVGNVVTWQLGSKSVPSNGTVSLTVKAATPLANGTLIKNTATLCDATPVCSNASHTMTVVSGPILSITKTSDVTGFTNPGKTVTYTVTVANDAKATDTAQNVQLTDVLPAGFTYADGGASTKTFALGAIAPGKSVSTSYPVVISAVQTAGTYVNTATAKADNAGPISASASVQVRLPEVLGASTAPNMTIVKKVSASTTNPGKVLTYTVTIKNTGDEDVTGVVLKDTLPKGFVFTGTKDSKKSWDIGTLAPNHERVINYDVTVGSSVKGGKYTNKAVASATNQESVTAKATVEVRVPEVLGLATTGPSLLDAGLAALGLALLAIGGFWFVRQRRSYGDAAIS